MRQLGLKRSIKMDKASPEHPVSVLADHYARDVNVQAGTLMHMRAQALAIRAALEVLESGDPTIRSNPEPTVK